MLEAVAGNLSTYGRLSLQDLGCKASPAFVSESGSVDDDENPRGGDSIFCLLSFSSGPK